MKLDFMLLKERLAESIGRRHPRLKWAAWAVLSLSIFSSTPVEAGFRDSSIRLAVSSQGLYSVGSGTNLAANCVLHLPPLAIRVNDAVWDTTEFDPYATVRLKNPTVAGPMHWNLDAPMADNVDNVNVAASSKREEVPLLIPLPTAISSGMCGLLAIAILVAPERFRRRLFR